MGLLVDSTFVASLSKAEHPKTHDAERGQILHICPVKI